jgi:NitT/TauT family transport system ATP-binding protein
MDEPFGALDAQTRQVLQQETDRIWRFSGCTVVFVTHDIDEAILPADRIAVMTAGPAASIKSPYNVELARPRDEGGPAAIELRRRMRQDIGEEVRKSLHDQGLDQDPEPGRDQDLAPVPDPVLGQRRSADDDPHHDRHPPRPPPELAPRFCPPTERIPS